MSLGLGSQRFEEVEIPTGTDHLALVGVQQAGATLGDGHGKETSKM